MHQDVERILIDRETTEKRVRELGREISRDYEGKYPLLVGILKGSFIFMSDLCRQMECDCSMDFMAASSYYGSTSTSGRLKIVKDLDTNIQNRHVIVVEDIIDSGVTLSRIVELLKSREPASLKLCTLLDKPARRQIKVPIDYCGFTIPDAFVVGYGFDYGEKYRNLPDICVLRPEVYTK